ncbi:MAG TPA: choice-of-anchor J domain-containing protein [Dokdonella sp.]|uniref:choice-of-anchor J domain-containing protein n=1 Tax=Dokdonella sp. TaxID=2291710 RepID=UPI002D7E85CD|nr:choice-of-anchor J domain-containing protein [Dokdonella sp.]HET9032090.1 choice-of-anchor J domain-containing protein [Dokdonella sp.]
MFKKTFLIAALGAFASVSAYADRASEPLQPKDYSHDYQVASSPNAPLGSAAVLTESFDSGIPGTWSVVDNSGGVGPVWTNLAGCGEAANYTNGSGDVACVSSDVFGGAEFDTELRTPVIDLSTYTTPAALTFNVNYQNFATLDFFEVDVSTNGAAGPWTNLLSWNEDHGAFRATPGEAVNLDIAPYVGQANVMFRFHYFDPNTGDYDWYAQVDDVVVSAVGGGGGTPLAPAQVLPISSPSMLAALGLLLAGLAFFAMRKQRARDRH